MRAEEAGDDLDRSVLPEPARSAQHARLGHKIEAVARLDLDRGDALGDETIEARQAGVHEFVLGGGPRRLDGRDDAAAGARDLLVGGAGEPQLELVRAVAGIDQMGMAIDQPGRDPTAVPRDTIGWVPSRRP